MKENIILNRNYKSITIYSLFLLALVDIIALIFIFLALINKDTNFLKEILIIFAILDTLLLISAFPFAFIFSKINSNIVNITEDKFIISHNDFNHIEEKWSDCNDFKYYGAIKYCLSAYAGKFVVKNKKGDEVIIATCFKKDIRKIEKKIQKQINIC